MRIFGIAFAALLLASVPVSAKDGDRRAFFIKDFRLENGKVMPQATVMYATYGKLNAAHDNGVLLPSHYMADSHGYEWLIGPGKALDPARYFLVATELFGNGKSSSPSNTPASWRSTASASATASSSACACPTCARLAAAESSASPGSRRAR